jgi:5-methylcytosine-specific restriction endonuclease McrA
VDLVTLLRLCPRCGVKMPYPGRGPCEECRRGYERDKSRRRRQSQRDVRDSHSWQLVRAAVRRRDDNACRRCGSSKSLGVHHVVPIVQGGSAFSPDNLLTLCRRCHEAEEKNSARDAKSGFLRDDRHSRDLGGGETKSRSPANAEKTPSIG